MRVFLGILLLAVLGAGFVSWHNYNNPNNPSDVSAMIPAAGDETTATDDATSQRMAAPAASESEIAPLAAPAPETTATTTPAAPEAGDTATTNASTNIETTPQGPATEETV